MGIKSKVKKLLPKELVQSYKKHEEQKLMLKDSKETFLYAKKLKHRQNEKVKIAFVIYMPEVWNSLKSVHDAAYEDDEIETVIVAQPWISKLGQEDQNFQNEAFEFLKESYDDVVNAYDAKQNSWFDLEAFCPDYVFYTRPYNVEYYQNYKPEAVRKYARLCWIPYGYDVIRNHITESCYNIDFLRYITNVFAPSESILKWTEKKYAEVVKQGYLHIEYMGFPRFDLYAKVRKEQRQNDGTTVVLWTPRWTSENKGIMKSNFLNYYKQFLELAKNHLEFKIIIRPHPLMFDNYIKNGIMDKAEVEKIKTACIEMDNIEIDERKDYLLSIQCADIFVSDFSSLLVEIFATGKPVIYCDSSDEFAPECKKMDDWFIHATSWNEIEEALQHNKENEHVISAIDKNGILPLNMGNIGTDIINYLKKNHRKN